MPGLLLVNSSIAASWNGFWNVEPLPFRVTEPASWRAPPAASGAFCGSVAVVPPSAVLAPSLGFSLLLQARGNSDSASAPATPKNLVFGIMRRTYAGFVTELRSLCERTVTGSENTAKKGGFSSRTCAPIGESSLARRHDEPSPRDSHARPIGGKVPRGATGR